MPAVSASAPGKIIMFGEHAVVFGKPAIAVPVSEVRARAVVIAEPLFASGVVKLIAPDIDLEASLDDLPAEHPLATALRLTQAAIGLTRAPACSVRITSSIPIAAGLGSGSAVSVALIRAFSAFHGCPLSDEKVSDLAFEVDRLHHGTPSGIDNSVIAHKLPVYYVRDQPIEVLQTASPIQNCDWRYWRPELDRSGCWRFASALADRQVSNWRSSLIRLVRLPSKLGS